MKKRLPENHKNILANIGGMFCEPDGKVSFSRISSTIILVSWLVWVNFIVFSTKTFPQNTWEISTLIAALYSFNKVAAAITGTPDKG